MAAAAIPALITMVTEAGVAGAAMATAAVVAHPFAAAAIATTIGTGLHSANQAKQQGKTQQSELNRQADQEKIAAVDREGQRRRRLNEILSSSITQTGASGATFEGSPQAIAKAQIGQAELANSGAKVSDLSRISQLKRRGKAAKIMGKNRATETLLNTGAQTVGLLGS